MKRLLAATVLAVLMVSVLGSAVRPGSSPRQARWFLSRADVTEVVEQEKVITQVTPWSCVVVAPSLPPCRHVRQLDIAATPPTPILASAAPALNHFYGAHNLVEGRRRYFLDQGGLPSTSFDSYYGDMVPVPAAAPEAGWVPLMAREATEPLPATPAAAPAPPAPPAGPADSNAAPQPDKKREPQGWAEWLGLRAHTVTSTLVKYATTKVVDPDTVVTFSVRGCQPSKLPFDLPLCVAQQQGHSLAEATGPAVEVSPAAPAPSAPAPAEAAAAAAPAAAAEAPAGAAAAPQTPAENASPAAAPAAPVTGDKPETAAVAAAAAAAPPPASATSEKAPSS